MPMASVASDSRAAHDPLVADLPSRSPWIAQFDQAGPPRPLDADTSTDVAIVGAGIAGLATAFFILRSSDQRVLLLERARAASGATGRNAGQLTTYFERPLHDIAAEFGIEGALAGQRAFDDAHDLLDLIVAESGATVRVERFTGYMGMWSAAHLDVHLRNGLVRRAGGLRPEPCVVSEDAPFLGEIAAEFAGLYEVVPQARIHELLDTPDPTYRAVLSDRKGCCNSGLLVHQVLAYLERNYPDRFRFVDHTPVDTVIVGEGRATLRARGRVVSARHVVMCTNGFIDHVVEDAAGTAIVLAPEQRIVGRVGYMAAFAEPEPRTPAAMSYIRNAAVGGDTPYAYVTRRTYDHPGGTVTLTCMGGPEHPIEGPYDPDAPFPGRMLAYLDTEIRPFASPSRPPGQPYDFQWHGLMGYSDGGVRVIGAHPAHPSLLYNLGCNGVGFLPSLAGGQRVARLLSGEQLAPSIFDPR
jgi:glycine/D-amino acid oxidase-like deaminating enzyme